MTELKLPSLGESVENGTIVSILVEVGDRIVVDQPLMEVETDKVTAEVPSEVEGTVAEILVEVGDSISEGQLFMRISTEAAATPDIPAEASPEVEPEPQSVQEPARPIEKPAPFPLSSVVATAKTGFRASPLAKKVARELGLELADLSAISQGKRISVKDVKDYARKLNQSRSQGSALPAEIELPDFEKWGSVRRQPLDGISLATSKNMSIAWSQIPHAWLQEKADITALEAKRQLHKSGLKEQGIALTITSILVKIIAKALEEFPLFNASLDTNSKELIYKDYIHVGVAADTERGLLVPVIRNANQLNITQIASQLGQLSSRAREKKITADELQGATFTISNLGGIGTTGIFPIVNFPQVAIMGVAASQQEAVWINDAFQPRLMMPLTIGFDHRVINGADAARFLQHVKRLLEDWFLWSL